MNPSSDLTLWGTAVQYMRRRRYLFLGLDFVLVVIRAGVAEWATFTVAYAPVERVYGRYL